MEAVTSAIIDKLNWSRKKAASVVVGVGVVISMAFATNGGLLLLDLVDHFANNVGIMVGGFVEIALMAWIMNKVSEVREYVNQISDFAITGWFDICLRFITPVMLAIILATKLQTLLTEGYGGYDLTLGWVMIAVLLVVGLVINISSRKEAQ